MLVLTISRRDASGHTEPLVAISDPPFVRSVLASVGTIAIGEEDNDEPHNGVKVIRVADRRRNGE